jgi:hypothetical protein
MRHCRMPRPCDCTGSYKFTGRKYTVLFQKEGNQLTSILTIPESNYALIDFTKHVWEIITCKSLNRKIQNITLLCENKPSSSVRCLFVLFLCFISYFIAVLKKLPVWSLVQSGEVRWSVCLKRETKVAFNSAGKILNNVCPYTPPPTIAATFKKHTPYTLIYHIYHSKCTFRVFPLSCWLNCQLILRKPQQSDWQIAVCASFVSYKKMYS